MDLSERLQTLLSLDPTRRAIQYHGRWETWGDLASRVDALDLALQQADLGDGTAVGLVTRNRPAHVATMAAVLCTRRCLVPISSIAADPVVIAELGRLDIAALVADEQDWARVGLLDECRARGILGIEVGADPHTPLRLHVPPTPRPHEPQPGVAVLMPTSGTTGPPKRIQYTYERLNGALTRIANYSSATARSLGGEPGYHSGVVIAPLALAHVGGFWAAMQALVEGRTLALLDRFEPLAWAALVQEHQAKISPLPPAAMRMVMDADIPVAMLQSLVSVACGTAPLDPDLADAFTARFGVPVLTAYGATEFPGGLVGWSLGDYQMYWKQKRGSAGRARPGITIRIVDHDSNETLRAGAEGIISVCSPQATVASSDGWIRTTDIGRMDDDGFLWIVGRADDAIIRGGFKVLPQTVEAALRSHPSVVEAGVTGLPDERLGQVPVAAVVVREAVEPTELMAWVRDRLPSYAVPVEIRVVSELPRTTSMKVAKAELRALFGASN
ncbi:MAG: AMP-dependent synthetase [Acidimicrobiia bacterium]|nr:AMP-dependent synthetase [Acidimicrobiia bacterium]